jgi:hypothetical protein
VSISEIISSIWGENRKNQVNNEMLLLALWRVFDINIGAVLL